MYGSQVVFFFEIPVGIGLQTGVCVRNDHWRAQFLSECFKTPFGLNVTFGLRGVGIHQQIGFPGQVVHNNQFVDMQQHQVGRTFALPGREGLNSRPQF